MSSAMRALSNVDAGVVKAEIEIAATPARVFQSLTDANELAAWWAPMTCSECSSGSPNTSRPSPTEPSQARTSATSDSSHLCLPQCDPSPDRP